MEIEKQQELVVVIVNDDLEINEKFDFFIRLIGEDRVKQAWREQGMAFIRSDNCVIRITLPRTTMRGMKAHQLFNLVQDIEFHNECAMPMTNIRRF